MARKGTLTKAINLPDGTRKWVYAKTKEELQQKLLDYQVQINIGIDLTNHDTFGEYALRWYRIYKEPNVSDNSKTSILNVLNTHLLPYLSGYRIKDITPMHIQQIFNRIAKKSQSLNEKVRTYLNEILDTAVANRLIALSPLTKSINIKGKAAKEKEALTEEEVQAILQRLKDEPSIGAQAAYLFCLIGFKTGLRRGELCGLMWSDFDFDAGEITVQRSCVWPGNAQPKLSEDMKTAAAHRVVPIPHSAMPALRQAASNADSLYVFHGEDGRPLSYSALRNIWNHTKKSGIEFTPHQMRHTYCTRLVEKGLEIKEVQYLMGHSKPEMTLRIYTHYTKRSRYNDTAARVRAAL